MDYWKKFIRKTHGGLTGGPRAVARTYCNKINNLRKIMAERVGFEPTIRSPVCRISSAVLSTTQPPLRFAGRRFGSAGCLIATKAGAGKRQIPVRRSFFLDSSGALAYAHERSGVEWIPCLFLLRAALRAGVKNPPAEGFGPTAQRLAKRRPPSGRAGTNMKG